MKRIANLLMILTLVAFAVALIPQPILAMTGSGTEGDPYMIYDWVDLQNVNNNLTAYYELANDIDATGVTMIGDGGHYTTLQYPIDDFSVTGAWTVYPASPTTLWDKVDDGQPSDGDSSYIQATANGDNAIFLINSLNVPTDAAWVDVYVGITCKRIGASASSAQRYLRVDGVEYLVGSAFNPSTSYPSGEVYWQVGNNPATGLPWTVSEVNSIMGFGVYIHDNTSPVRVTNLYIRAYYYNAFTGVFNGNNYTIYDLNLNYPTEDGLGLFGCTDSGAIIRNLVLQDPVIIGDDDVGALIGEALDTTVENVVVVNASVTGDWFVGGLVGYNYNSLNLTDCGFDGSVIGGDEIGGLIGCTYSTVNITGCAASGSVGYYDYCDSVGGLVGENRAALTIFQSYTTCSVYGGYYVGGLVGISGWGGTLNISQCFTTGDITGEDWGVGGLVGDASEALDLVLNCYARGAITGDEAVGGAFGSFYDGSFGYVYSTGLVIGNSDVGGLHGYDGSANEIYTSFWDKQTSNQTTSVSGTGETTADMKISDTYTCEGWDFNSVWSICGNCNDGYPVLRWAYPWCSGFPDDIYQVLWFQPNDIIEGTVLPNRAEETDGEFHWGANPAGITISHGELVPEEEYDFEPLIPSGSDIIKPEPSSMVSDVDLARLRDNPLYPLVQTLTIAGFLTERLVWLLLAWLILIIAMFAVHLGLDTHRGSQKPQHFVLTTITGLGLSILFYTMGIFPWWVIFLMGVGVVGAIIWERQPVI